MSRLWWVNCFQSVLDWCILSNFKSNALWGGTVLKNDGTVKGAVRWVRWYGTVGTVGTVRWVRWVRYSVYAGWGGFSKVLCAD